jgi:hypothetical protein
MFVFKYNKNTIALFYSSIMKNLLFIVLLMPFISHAQINKGNWLVGGILGGNYSESENFRNARIEETTNKEINLIGQVGYFPIKKLAIGLNTQYTSSSEELSITSFFPTFNQTYETGENIIAVGPFVRYYLLSPDKKFNFYFQGSLQKGTVQREALSVFDIGSPVEKEKTDLFAYHLSAAPVYIINKKVSLELLLNYSKMEHFDVTNRFSAAIGLQVHLGK